MEVIKDGKKLYHIQATTGWCDEPYDIYVFADHYPTSAEVRQLYLNEREDLERDDEEVNDFVKYHNVYKVYAGEV